MTDRAAFKRSNSVETDLTQLFRNLPIALGLLDRDLRYVWVNERLAGMNGRSVEDHIGRTVHEVIPDLAEQVVPVHHSVMETGRPVCDLEVAGATPVAPDAGRRFLASFLPWKGATGEAKGVCAVVEDITEPNQAQEKLRKSEERFRSLIEQSPLAIEILSPDGQIKEVNAAWSRLWNLSAEERLQTLEKYNMLTDKQTVQLGVAPLIKRAFAGEAVVLPPIEYIGNRTLEDIGLGHIRGRSPWIQCHLYPVKDANHEVMYVVNTYMDITELKQAEADASQHRDALLHVDRVANMGELSASLAHELNQPLAAILSNAQAGLRFLEKDSPDLDMIRHIFSRIVADDKRAGEVIRRLRSIMRKEKEEQEPVSVNQVMHDVISLVHSEMIGKRVALTSDLAEDLPYVWGNRVELQHVVLNLLSNAREAMEDTPFDRRQIVLRTESDNREVRVSVADSGPGIPDENLEQVFAAFYTGKKQGLGMGLAICRSIIEAHGGRFWAENRPQGGAQLCFSIPAHGNES